MGFGEFIKTGRLADWAAPGRAHFLALVDPLAAPVELTDAPSAPTTMRDRRAPCGVDEARTIPGTVLLHVGTVALTVTLSAAIDGTVNRVARRPVNFCIRELGP